MKSKKSFSSLPMIAAIALTTSVAAFAYDPAAAHDKDGLARFVSAHADRAAGAPFSFDYDGKPSSAFLSKWPSTSETKTSGDKILKTIVYTDPATRLRVTVVYTIYRDYPAVEWVVRFKNEGSADTPIIENVLASAVRFEDWPEGPATLYRARGSDAERADFGPIADALADGTEVAFGTRGGRSSDAALPFFNIASPARGVMVAVGWTGRWKAAVKRTGPRAIGIDAGLERTRFRLHPGEDVRTPMICLLFWRSADRFDGHNLFRRFVLAHHEPRPNGKLVEPPLSHGIGYGGPFPCNEYSCATESYALAMIDRLSQFGIEPDAYWIDAGWYERAGPTWWEGVGTWSPDKKRFPRGLKPIGDTARSRGKRFVLWFEPERVYQGTALDREHPEWLVRLPDSPDRVFNLGDPAALAWMIDHVANFMIAEGVTIYRQDFNVNAAPYWRTLDAHDRIGIAEIKHIEGLYAYWDALLARVPGLMIDNCAGGGRRLDLETMGRSIPLWRTDSAPFEPDGEQCHTYGLQLYVPFSGTGNSSPQKYAFRSAIGGGAVVLAWDVNGSVNNPAINSTLARDDIAEFHDLRPYLHADYYPLTEYSTADDVWAVFQWNRPEERDGIVLAFRRGKSLEATQRLALHGLDPAVDYELSFEDYGLVIVKSGRELMGAGGGPAGTGKGSMGGGNGSARAGNGPGAAGSELLGFGKESPGGLDVKIPDPGASLLIKYRRLGSDQVK